METQACGLGQDRFDPAGLLLRGEAEGRCFIVVLPGGEHRVEDAGQRVGGGGDALRFAQACFHAPDVVSQWTFAVAQGLAAQAQTVPSVTPGDTRAVDSSSEVRGFSRREIRVADGPDGAGLRRVPATTVALPAFAGQPSENNFRRVVDARNRIFWIASSSLIIGEPKSNCLTTAASSDAYASRGIHQCRSK